MSIGSTPARNNPNTCGALLITDTKWCERLDKMRTGDGRPIPARLKVEIEIGVLRGQCLDRRIDDPKRLRREVAAWERRRNAARGRIKWMFTTDKARAKMRRAYPDTPKDS
jgi:hypothetical protein